MKNLLRFACTVIAGIAMAGTLFFALSFNTRMDLDKESYSLVHRAISTSTFDLFVEGLTLVLTLAWMLSERQTVRRFYSLLGSAIFSAVSLAIYVFFILPTNTQTHGWTQLSDSFPAVRSQWEYAQLIRGICTFCAFCLIVVNLLIRRAKANKLKYPTKPY